MLLLSESGGGNYTTHQQFSQEKEMKDAEWKVEHLMLLKSQ